MRALASCIGLSLGLGYAAASPAQTVPPPSLVPQSSFYVGLGGSFNSVNFGTQDVYAVGTSDVTKNGVLVSTGMAAGPADIYTTSQQSFAPVVQGGYFQHIPDTEWLWGAKFSYSDLDTTATVRGALLPQAGSFTSTQSHETVPFTGNAVVGSYQTTISHQMTLVPFFGRSLQQGYVYVGAGPTLSQSQTKLNELVGFADINGQHTDVSGAPQNFSSTAWVFGGAAVVGGTYFFNPLWFLDVSYAFAMTQSTTGNYASTFTNPSQSLGSTTSGTLAGSSSGSVVTQGVTVTLNRAF